jgi:hypothetical protein
MSLFRIWSLPLQSFLFHEDLNLAYTSQCLHVLLIWRRSVGIRHWYERAKQAKPVSSTSLLGLPLGVSCRAQHGSTEEKCNPKVSIFAVRHDSSGIHPAYEGICSNAMPARPCSQCQVDTEVILPFQHHRECFSVVRQFASGVCMKLALNNTTHHTSTLPGRRILHGSTNRIWLPMLHIQSPAMNDRLCYS